MTQREAHENRRGVATATRALLARERRAGGWLALACCLAMVLAACGGEVTLVGTELDRRPAPNFTLQDHTGQTVSLSDFAGRPVLLTFIYTNCPDVCPLTAATIRQAYDRLPENRRHEVALLAVTVDPERDTAAVLTEFSRRHDLAGVSNWHALTGDRDALAATWRNYGVDPGAMLNRNHTDHGEAVGTPTTDAAAKAYLLAHTDAIYLIDSEGRQRALVRSNISPDDLAHNLTALLP